MVLLAQRKTRGTIKSGMRPDIFDGLKEIRGRLDAYVGG